MRYTCPVCGYPELEEDPRTRSFEICPSCLTEFGYSDARRGYDALRADWIAEHARWGSEIISRPLGWSAVEQLRNIDYEATEEDLESISRGWQGIISRVSSGIRNAFIRHKRWKQ